METMAAESTTRTDPGLPVFSRGQSDRTWQRIVDLPFNALLELELCENSDCLLRLKARPALANHIGTIHAGALMTLAEATSAEFLLRRFGHHDDVVPLLRRFEAKFCGLASGTITSTACAEKEALDRFHAEITAKGRSLVTIDVQLQDPAGQRVMTAAATWFVRCKT